MGNIVNHKFSILPFSLYKALIIQGFVRFSNTLVQNLIQKQHPMSGKFRIFAQILQETIMAKEMLLPNRLKEIRLQSNMPQRKIAAELDIDTATYCKYENGVMRMSIAQLEKIIKCLNANHDELLTLWQADQFCNAVSTDMPIAKEAMEIVINQYQAQK